LEKQGKKKINAYLLQQKQKQKTKTKTRKKNKKKPKITKISTFPA
jgi:hypothetical protein